MYRCKECTRKFETPKKVVETHGQIAPPFEVFYVCPFCKSTNYERIAVSFCRCCGRRLNNSEDLYCNDNCRLNAIKLKHKEELRKQSLIKNPLNVLMREVEKYNNEHHTKYSYGQYIAIIKPKLGGNKNDR
ncbi:MAG: hypothetical protein IJA44_04305 [Clostridia bacterium]|nr:hypothetical protein [Clostridia bacterium]